MPDERRGPAVRARAGFDLERFMPYQLSSVSNRVSRAFSRTYAREFGLTIPEWRVLAILGRYAPLSSNEICDRSAMDKAKVSRAVAALVRRGLVRREQNTEDLRLIRLTFTSSGRSIYERIVPRALELERELTQALAPGDREALNRVLAALARATEAYSSRREAEDEGDAPPSID